MSWHEDFRAAFPLCEERVFLFAGAQAPLATRTRQGIEDFLDTWSTEVWRYDAAGWQAWEETVTALGTVLGCEPDRIVPVTNTSEAANLAALMVLARWRADGERPANVVLHHDAHPASSYAWLNAVRLGAALELRWADQAPGESAEDALIRLTDEDTIAVVVTHVSHLTGERVDADRLVAALEPLGAALVLDAAQSAGVLPMADLLTACDFVLMPAYKWLLGPPGLGFLVVRSDWLDEVGPPMVGWASTSDHLTFELRRMDLAPRASAFRTGTPNFVCLAGCVPGLRLLLEAGPDRISQRIEELTEHLLNGLHELGHRSPTPVRWSRRAGIVAVDLPDAEGVMDRLLAGGVEVGVEDGLVRIDPHAYNTHEEIETVLRMLGRERRANV